MLSKGSLDDSSRTISLFTGYDFIWNVYVAQFWLSTPLLRLGNGQNKSLVITPLVMTRLPLENNFFGGSGWGWGLFIFTFMLMMCHQINIHSVWENTFIFINMAVLNELFVPRLVQTMDYSVIVFDTAPTGHTLRLLQFPSTLEKGLSKIMSLKSRFGGLLGQVPFPI